jgi:Fe(3+) dicitrate transport protein
MAGGVASAQSRAMLSGKVSDQRGGVISASIITLWQRATGFERIARTDESGAFRFDNLVEGNYRLTVSGAGFGALTRDIVLSAAESANVDLTLAAAAIAEEVVINGNQLAETPEELKRTPGAVDFVDKAMLENSRVFTFAEALRKVSGINVRDDEGFGTKPHISIRGVNPTRSTKILLLEDGIPLSYAPYGDNASYYHPPIERFEAIEVLKGSGQILYGPVTVAGVINYVTPNPPPKPSGHLTLIGGTRDYFNGELNLGGTWRGVGLLFNYVRKQGEGARENVRSGINDFNFKLVTGLGSRQALTFRTSYYGEDSNVTYSGLTETEYRANPRGNPFRNDFFYGNRIGASATHAVVLNNNLLLTTNIYGSSFSRDWWRQSSNSLQRPNDAADPACAGMANLNTTCGNEGRLRDYYMFGVEPRFQLNHSLFEARGELDFGFRVHLENQNRIQENGNRPTSRSGVIVEDNQRNNQAYSAYIQNRFIVGNLNITPGVRIEHIRFERANRLANAGTGITGRTELTQVVPGAGVSYNFRERLTVFAGVHRGFAPPRTEDIISNTTGGVIELDPELSWNYEVGLRSLFQPGVRVEATFFRLDYENQIVPASVAGGLGATLTNGGETLHQGFELTARVDTGTILRSPHNLYFRSAYTWLPDAKFTGSRFSAIPSFTSVSVTGNRLPYAPEHLVNFTVGYSGTSGFDALIEANYVGRQFGDDLNTVNPSPDGQRGLIPSHIAWNSTCNYTVESWHTTFFISAKNLFDRIYIVDRVRGLLPGTPRLIQAGVKFSF